MADPRSVMQEFRFLEQKRQAGPLTPAEATRHAELRDLVGFEQPLPARGGFDVSAAAAQLRESLLPAGLRSRPSEAPPPAVEPAAWAPPAPVAPVEPPAAPEPEPVADRLFDPATLGEEVRPQAWNPEAPGYDPDAPYDEAAWIAAGYDPNVTYDWSALGEGTPVESAQPAEPQPADQAPADLAEADLGPDELAPADAELVDLGAADLAPADASPADLGSAQLAAADLPPLQFGDYDGPGAPLRFGEPVEPAVPAPAPDGDGTWFDDSGEPPAPPPPLTAPVFGEYDAPLPVAPAAGADGEPFYGGPEGESLPGGTPLELGAAPSDWQPEGALEAGFELASDGSFGDPAAPAQAAPWSASEPSSAPEHWENAPPLDLSTPFAPVPIPSARGPEPAPEAELEPLVTLEPEEALEPVPAPPAEPAPAPPEPTPELALEPVPGPALEPLPGALGGLAAPLDLAEGDADAEPVSLDELGSAVEIDVPPEIAAAYDAPPPPAFDFGAPPPPPPPPVAAEAVTPATLEGGPGPALLPEPELEMEPLAPAGASLVAGAHRVVVHTLGGEVLRGTLTDTDLEAPELELDTGAAGPPTAVASAGVKAIFFMLSPGEPPPAPQGKRVRVAFRDGRQVAGFSPDYHEGGVGFFMIPADTRTNTGRIWVYQAAVKQVSVS